MSQTWGWQSSWWKDRVFGIFAMFSRGTEAGASTSVSQFCCGGVSSVRNILRGEFLSGSAHRLDVPDSFARVRWKVCEREDMAGSSPLAYSLRFSGLRLESPVHAVSLQHVPWVLVPRALQSSGMVRIWGHSGDLQWTYVNESIFPLK